MQSDSRLLILPNLQTSSLISHNNTTSMILNIQLPSKSNLPISHPSKFTQQTIREFPQPYKRNLEKPTSYLTVKDRKLLSKDQNTTKILALTTPTQHLLEAIRQENEIKVSNLKRTK